VFAPQHTPGEYELGGVVPPPHGSYFEKWLKPFRFFAVAPNARRAAMQIDARKDLGPQFIWGAVTTAILLAIAIMPWLRFLPQPW
jgi:hypothetical protein